MATKFVLAVVAVACLSVCGHAATQTMYRAAVSEHRILSGKTPLETMYNNVKVYAEQARIAAREGADIIVFPEYGITGLSAESRDEMYEYLQQVPNPSRVKWNPCLESEDDEYEEEERTEIVKELSCIAHNNSIVVVANLGTLETCDNETNTQCPADNRFQFNTNVAFNANGTLVGVYHKHHLYNEPAMDPSPEPEYSIFNAGFAKFGMFVCFDLMFFDPAVKLVKNLGIRNIAFSTHWIDQLPFLTAIQSQSMWAFGMGVNLLAANAFHPQEGALGSGIYSSVNGAINYTYDPFYPDRLIIADVPINPPPGPIFDPNEEEPPVLHNTPLFIDLGTKVIRFGPFKQRNKDRRAKRDTSDEMTTEILQSWDLADNDTDTNGTRDDSSDDDFNYEINGTSAEETVETTTSSTGTTSTTTAVYNDHKQVKNKNPSRYRHYHLIFYEPLDKFGYVFLNAPLGQEYVCYNGLCCILKYGISQYSKDDVYALVAFKGHRPTFGGHSFDEQVCAVIRCVERNISSCGKLQADAPIGYFDYFRLAGNFTTRYVYPTLITPDLRLISSDRWEFHTKEVRIPRVLPHPNSVRRHHLYNLLKNNIAVLESNQLSKQILTAGIYGRPYEDQGDDDDSQL